MSLHSSSWPFGIHGSRAGCAAWGSLRASVRTVIDQFGVRWMATCTAGDGEGWSSAENWNPQCRPLPPWARCWRGATAWCGLKRTSGWRRTRNTNHYNLMFLLFRGLLCNPGFEHHHCQHTVIQSSHTTISQRCHNNIHWANAVTTAFIEPMLSQQQSLSQSCHNSIHWANAVTTKLIEQMVSTATASEPSISSKPWRKALHFVNNNNSINGTMPVPVQTHGYGAVSCWPGMRAVMLCHVICMFFDF